MLGIVSASRDSARSMTVGLLGLGATGRAIRERLLEREGIEIVAAVDKDPALASKQLSSVIEGANSEVIIEADASALVEAQALDVAVVTIGPRIENLEGALRRL